MSKFVPTQEQLDRWATIPMTFKTTNAVKSAFKRLGDYSQIPMSESYRNRLDHLSARDDEGRWINLYDANRGGAQLTQFAAHKLIEFIDGLTSHGVTVTSTQPKVAAPAPAKGHGKAGKSQTIVKPEAGIYELAGGAKVQVKVNPKTGRTTASIL
jgi:hypothetical protein